jgi:hypothetical protein
MPLVKVPKKSDSDQIDDFINSAPDGPLSKKKINEIRSKRYRKGNKAQITLTFDDALLDQIEFQAKRMGLNRTAFISLAVTQFLENG